MKNVLLTICCVVLFVVGCDSIEVDGFSVGALYLNTTVESSSTHSIGGYSFGTKQKNTIEEIVPMLLLNFKFKKFSVQVGPRTCLSE